MAKKSGLKVNDDKTEICQYQGNALITISGVTVQCKTNMNVLRVIFDSKLNWNNQIPSTINKTNE